MDQEVKLIHIIYFLDSLCLGFLTPIVLPIIFGSGGCHTVDGLFHGLHFLVLKLWPYLTEGLVAWFSMRITLLATLVVAFISVLLLGSAESWILLGPFFIAFDSSHQIRDICETKMLLSAEKREAEGFKNLLPILKVAGLVVGPILGGRMIEVPGGLFYIIVISALLCAVNIVLITQFPTSEDEATEDIRPMDVAVNIKGNLQATVQHLLDPSLWEIWDLQALVFVFHFSYAAFMTKFALILFMNFEASPSLIGFTIAFHSAAVFGLSNYVVPLISEKVFGKLSNPMKLLQGFGCLTASYAIACFAPAYFFYLISFVGLALGFLVMESAWNDILSRSDSGVQQAESVANVAKFLAPLMSGIAFDILGSQLGKLSIIGPMAAGLYIIYKYDSPFEIKED